MVSKPTPSMEDKLAALANKFRSPVVYPKIHLPAAYLLVVLLAAGTISLRAKDLCDIHSQNTLSQSVSEVSRR